MAESESSSRDGNKGYAAWNELRPEDRRYVPRRPVPPDAGEVAKPVARDDGASAWTVYGRFAAWIVLHAGLLYAASIGGLVVVGLALGEPLTVGEAARFLGERTIGGPSGDRATMALDRLHVTLAFVATFVAGLFSFAHLAAKAR